MVSGSWDKTVRLWDVFESKGNVETFQLTADGGFYWPLLVVLYIHTCFSSNVLVMGSLRQCL